MSSEVHTVPGTGLESRPGGRSGVGKELAHGRRRFPGSSKARSSTRKGEREVAHGRMGEESGPTGDGGGPEAKRVPSAPGQQPGGGGTARPRRSSARAASFFATAYRSEGGASEHALVPPMRLPRGVSRRAGGEEVF